MIIKFIYSYYSISCWSGHWLWWVKLKQLSFIWFDLIWFNAYVSYAKDNMFAWCHYQCFQVLYYLEAMSMSLIPRLQVQEDTDMSSLEDVSDCSSDSMEVCCEDLGKPFWNHPEFMTRILHLLCDLLLKAFDFDCG